MPWLLPDVGIYQYAGSCVTVRVSRVRTAVSTKIRGVLTCAHDFPSPAIQIQCTHNILPLCSATNHGLRGLFCTRSNASSSPGWPCVPSYSQTGCTLQVLCKPIAALGCKGLCSWSSSPVVVKVVKVSYIGKCARVGRKRIAAHRVWIFSTN